MGEEKEGNRKITLEIGAGFQRGFADISHWYFKRGKDDILILSDSFARTGLIDPLAVAPFHNTKLIESLTKPHEIPKLSKIAQASKLGINAFDVRKKKDINFGKDDLIWNNIALMHQDAHNLTFRDESISTVFMHNLLGDPEFFTGPKQPGESLTDWHDQKEKTISAVKEAVRVLEPGGKLIIAETSNSAIDWKMIKETLAGLNLKFKIARANKIPVPFDYTKHVFVAYAIKPKESDGEK